MEETARISKLYTPLQIRLGSFLGGPIAAVHFLRENFRVLGKVAEARTALVWGVAFIVGLMVLLPFLPDHFPNYVVPLLYSFAAGSVAEKWQLPKQSIIASGIYGVQSNWRVFGFALLAMIAFLVILLAELFGLNALGLVDL
jgi:hypothetical protein